MKPTAVSTSGHQHIGRRSISGSGDPPVASVLMVVYNHASCLKDAIEGVLAQKADFEFELLIGEDCSQDGSLAIALEYEKRYPQIVRIITSESNVGMLKNARRIFEASRGEYVAYCEGDDYWTDSTKLQRQIDFLIAHPTYGAVHSDFEKIYFRRGAWRGLKGANASCSRHIPEGDVFIPLLSENFIQTCTFCARADIIRAALECGLPIDSYPVGDWPKFLFLAAHSRIGYMKESTAVYRRTPGSVMNSGPEQTLKLAKAYESMLGDVFGTFGVDSAEQLRALSRLHSMLLSLALFAGDKRAFAESWQWLRRHDPGETTMLRRRLMPWLMRFGFARRVVIGLVRMRTFMFDEWRYRRSATPPARVSADASAKSGS
jgi:glycosyltransferase involved in cell wall biosynthesis